MKPRKLFLPLLILCSASALLNVYLLVRRSTEPAEMLAIEGGIESEPTTLSTPTSIDPVNTCAMNQRGHRQNSVTRNVVIIEQEQQSLAKEDRASAKRTKHLQQGSQPYPVAARVADLLPLFMSNPEAIQDESDDLKDIRRAQLSPMLARVIVDGQLAVDALLDVISDATDQRRKAALDLLGLVVAGGGLHEDGLDQLNLRLLEIATREGDDLVFRAEVVDALQFTSDGEVTPIAEPIVLDLAKSRHAAIRTAAIRKLGEIGSDGARRELRRIALDGSEPTPLRTEAITSLLVHENDLQLVLDLTRNQVPEIRRTAFVALADRDIANSDATRYRLHEALQHERDPENMKRIIWALSSSQGDLSTVPVLEQFAAQEAVPPSIRAEARNAVETIVSRGRSPQ